LALPVALLLAATFPGATLAAEPTSGYGNTTTTPTTPTKTTPTTKTTPPASTTPKSSSEPSAAKESTTTPAKEAAPATTSTVPTSTTTKESTLPFTGWDLRWVVGIGLLIIGAGFSLLWVQRRQRGGDHSSR
jgi:hypothetical protein